MYTTPTQRSLITSPYLPYSSHSWLLPQRIAINWPWYRSAFIVHFVWLFKRHALEKHKHTPRLNETLKLKNCFKQNVLRKVTNSLTEKSCEQQCRLFLFNEPLNVLKTTFRLVWKKICPRLVYVGILWNAWQWKQLFQPPVCIE